MIAYGRCLDNSPSTNMDVVAYLHRIVIEVPSVRFVRGPNVGGKNDGLREVDVIPQNASLSNKTIPPERDHHSVPRASAPKITSNDRIA